MGMPIRETNSTHIDLSDDATSMTFRRTGESTARSVLSVNAAPSRSSATASDTVSITGGVTLRATYSTRATPQASTTSVNVGLISDRSTLDVKVQDGASRSLTVSAGYDPPNDRSGFGVSLSLTRVPGKQRETTAGATLNYADRNGVTGSLGISAGPHGTSTSLGLSGKAGPLSVQTSVDYSSATRAIGFGAAASLRIDAQTELGVTARIGDTSGAIVGITHDF